MVRIIVFLLLVSFTFSMTFCVCWDYYIPPRVCDVVDVWLVEGNVSQDVNYDGIVNFRDYAIIARQYQEQRK